MAVGISGPDCAGKSTLAAKLEETLEPPVLIVPCDEFTRPTRERYAERNEGIGYYRDAFDYSGLFEKLLPAVRRGNAAEVVLRVSDWERDSWREATFTLAPNTVVIAEGCFLFAGGRARELDLSVWLDLPLEQVVGRALARPRDVERMGGPDGVRERYALRYLPGQRLHLERDDPKGQADIVVPV